MAKAVKLYWDTCAWLGLINGEDGKKRELEIVYGHARQGKYELWTSTLSMVECRRLASENNVPRPLDDAAERLIGDLFAQPFVKAIPLAVDIAHSARKIWRATPGLGNFQDAIHIASALRWNVEVMHTYDADDLLHLSGKFQCQDGRTQ